jgi:hypothetical protein
MPAGAANRLEISASLFALHPGSIFQLFADPPAREPIADRQPENGQEQE